MNHKINFDNDVVGYKKYQKKKVHKIKLPISYLYMINGFTLRRLFTWSDIPAKQKLEEIICVMWENISIIVMKLFLLSSRRVILTHNYMLSSNSLDGTETGLLWPLSVILS
jgi:hypothetical protein